MSSGLPDRPSLEYLKKQARERLRELRIRVPETQLADAQHAIARDYGFPSWPKLKAHVDALTASKGQRVVERALAVHLKDRDKDALFGVALLVPSVRYAAMLVEGVNEARERKLKRSVWRQIDSWVSAGDLGLPAEPAPLSPSVVTALLENERPTISAHRVASFPMRSATPGDLNSTAKRLLPRLLHDWRPSIVKPTDEI